MICKNCDLNVDSHFCSNCGQSSNIHAISVKSVFHDFLHAFTHADKGLLLTIKELLTRPGFVALEYINGRRKKYFNPLSFLVITMALSAYLSYKSGYFEAVTGKPKSEQSVKTSKSVPKYVLAIYEGRRIVVEEGKLLGLILMTPLIAFLSWAFFRKPKHGYAEHFVLQSYFFGLSNVGRVVIFIPLHLMIPGGIQIIDYIFQAVFLTYLIVACRQFFQQHIAITILKGVLILVSFILLFWSLIYSFAYVKISLFN